MSSGKAPGLSSLNESRHTRHRRLVTGKAAIGGIPTKWFLAGLAILVAIGAATFFQAQSERHEKRSSLMAKQRAVAQLLAPKLLPLQKSVEDAVLELAKEQGQSRVSLDTDFDKLLGSSGIYLRLRTKSATDSKAIRKSAADSLRDGFTSCLLRDMKAPLPTVGAACKVSSECQPGELCTEYQVCQRPTSPFNMAVVYRAMRVLTDDWVKEVSASTSELALDAYDRGLDSVSRVDVPAAIEVYQRAKYFVLVLDEEAPGGLPKALGEPGDETEFERLQRVAHDARVGIFELPSGKELAFLRAKASGELRSVGREQGTPSEFALAARSRQANNCGLALEVKSKLDSLVRTPTTNDSDAVPPRAAP